MFPTSLVHCKLQHVICIINCGIAEMCPVCKLSHCCQIVELHHVLERFWLFEYPYLQVKVRKLPLVLLQKISIAIWNCIMYCVLLSAGKKAQCVYSKPNASLADSHGVKYARALFGFCIYDHVKTFGWKL